MPIIPTSDEAKAIVADLQAELEEPGPITKAEVADLIDKHTEE